LRRNLKDSQVNIGEDLPKRVQDIRNKILVPAMKKARAINPRNKASVIADKLIVNGKHYLHYNIPKRWLSTDSSNNSSKEPPEDAAEMPNSAPDDHVSE